MKQALSTEMARNNKHFFGARFGAEGAEQK